MKKSFQTAFLSVAFLSIATALNAGEPTASHGGPDAKSAVSAPLESSGSAWQFIIEPYGWTTGLDGTTRVGGFQASGVDMNLKQVIAELALAYRLVEGPAGFVDLYGGFRYNYLSLDAFAANGTSMTAFFWPAAPTSEASAWAPT